MSTWLTAWRNRENREPTGPIMELSVVAGEDAGNQFTLEGNEVLIGRGRPESGQTDVVRLADKSISRRQAWIRRDATGTTIEHIGTASNPTLLNGVEITTARLAVGDRIEMGRVAIEVRARGGMNLHGLTEIMEVAARESTMSGTIPLPTSTTSGGLDESTARPPEVDAPGEEEKGLADAPTEVRPMRLDFGELSVLRGVDSLDDGRFPLSPGVTRIGRGEDVEVQIPDLGVSRLHAEIRVEGRGIVLTPRSRTNPTLLNGLPVLEPVELRDGDEIQLADQVLLELRLASSDRKAATGPGTPASDLSRRMEAKIGLDRAIEEFNVMGSFLDVDVVASRAMKSAGEKAEFIIVSFERFRAYVGGIVEEWGGQVLNSNGDELMCFFEAAESAVLAGSAILERLADFNRDLNLLSRDFRFRLGVHTGVSLVDLDAGIAYSEVLDTAGHIQKLAEPDRLVISQATLDSLSRPIPVTPVGELTGMPGRLYRVDRFLRRSDFED